MMKKQLRGDEDTPQDKKERKRNTRMNWWLLAIIVCAAVIIILYPYYSGYESKDDLETDLISYVQPANPDTSTNSGTSTSPYISTTDTGEQTVAA
ncbi:hypothetical protein [Bifidobacterium choloepi]|uniref:Uncharacterized protein n=1 Tax=Bifidobacterium choloepi TaxID=2614131 RepID=A0A6I5N471_9BIFI|nr:hypothetical protein [Bifidobacterium choloepi]NEG70479.1 hypothetical protein [Bifidobacterium choloepi]